MRTEAFPIFFILNFRMNVSPKGLGFHHFNESYYHHENDPLGYANNIGSVFGFQFPFSSKLSPHQRACSAVTNAASWPNATDAARPWA